ncbi:MAG: hypothetical protein DHS80DRAFT_22448 [Piptocephalis tieghemiana]|nr:MAG: hypothetical protein DHS80DRAFT_22448 [Piptocephalis tieghemiana]
MSSVIASRLVRASTGGKPTRATLIKNKLTKGKGATLLSDQVTKIHLAFSPRGHPGPRYLLRENFPRLQYLNPKVQFQITRSADTHSTPSLAVHFQDGSIQDVPVGKSRSTDLCDALLKVAKASK